MELLFYSLAGIIVIVVIAVSRKSIVAGMEARSDIKRENKPSNNEEGIEDITNENIEKTNEQVKIINQIDDLILIVDKFNLHPGYPIDWTVEIRLYELVDFFTFNLKVMFLSSCFTFTSISQYSSGEKALISLSFSTTSFTATD